MRQHEIRTMQYHLFETAIGRCGIMWSDRGICHIQLPERNDNATRDRLLSFRWAEESTPPPHVRSVMEALRSHLAGCPQSFDSVAIDLAAVPEFHRKVYDQLRKLPPGVTVSYGELAEMAGSTNAARAVGRAMAKNPLPIIVPCHRVLASKGKIGGFSAYGGEKIKIELLKIDGIAAVGCAANKPR